MTQEERQLLLKDICARFPYEINLHIEFYDLQGDGKLVSRDVKLTAGNIGYCFDNSHWVDIKPYLRPMSSMTEEECITLSKLRPCETDAWKYIKTPIPLYIANIEQFDFFHRHHLDWRGLIHKGLALEAKEGMYES